MSKEGSGAGNLAMPQAPWGLNGTLLTGTNTDLIRELLVPLIGEDGSVPNGIHHKLHQA